jgi:LacI family transcriptional regulator
LPDRPRLSDVARAAGVHITTVSRALRGSEGVGEETAERIRRVAAELGYAPHPAATSLRTGRSKMIGVVVPRLTDIVLATIYEGIEEGAAAAGYQTVVANSGDDVATQRLRTETLLGMRVDGLILGDARTDSDLVHDLRKQGVKVVLTSRRLPGAVSVTCDDLEGGRLAGRHLLALGHRRVGIIAGRPYASTGIERTRGFREVYAEAGAPVPDEYVLTSPFDAEGGRRAAEALLALDPRPTALYAVNDFAAIGAMGTIRAAGLRVGEDVSVVGYNDVSIAADLPVSLTTVRSPMREMGRAAAAAVIKLIEGGTARSRRLAPTLVERASSRPAPRAR